MGQELHSGSLRNAEGQLGLLNLSSLPRGTYALTVFDEFGNRWTEWVQIQ
jgi:hypothetical protein